MEGKLIKFRLSLCLIKHHVVRWYVGVKVQVHVLLTSAIGGGESWDAGFGRFILGHITPVFFE